MRWQTHLSVLVVAFSGMQMAHEPLQFPMVSWNLPFLSTRWEQFAWDLRLLSLQKNPHEEKSTSQELCCVHRFQDSMLFYCHQQIPKSSFQLPATNSKIPQHRTWGRAQRYLCFELWFYCFVPMFEGMGHAGKTLCVPILSLGCFEVFWSLPAISD